MAEPFISEIKIFAGSFAPRGWAFCNGQALPVSQNTSLYSLIGTIYGGDGINNFQLPNMQGRVPMHPGHGAGLTNRSLGEKVGVETVPLTAANMPSHSHNLRASNEEADENDPKSDRVLADGELQMYNDPKNLRDMSADMIEERGVDSLQPHNNIQPIQTLNFIIALVGIYPSRG